MSWGARFVAAVDRLDRGKKFAVQVVGLVIVLGGLWNWGSVAVRTVTRAIKGFAPLEVQVREHLADFVRFKDDSEATLRILESDLHTIMEQNAVMQEQQHMIIERLDTVSIETRWLDCVRRREQDMDAGVPPRDCRPFGGGSP